MVKFDVVYDQFLTSMSSAPGCSWSSFTEEELKAELFNLLIRAIAEFRFPKIELDYDSGQEEVNGGMINYDYFVNDITQKEINVLLAYMKQFWYEYVVSNEMLYDNSYFDTSLNKHSPGMLLAQLRQLLELARREAKSVRFNYGREDVEGKSNLAKLNR